MKIKKEELIWVDKETAQKYEDLKDDTDKLIMINDYIESLKEETRQDYQSSLESMREDSVMYSGLLLQVKKEFEKTKNEGLSAAYKLWEDYDKEKSDILDKVDHINDALNPLLETLESINKQLDKINTYKFERVLDFISKFNGMSEQTKNVLKFLVDNFDEDGAL